MDEPILKIEDLRVHFLNGDKILPANNGISYEVHRGECVALIGESGSGKSVSALSILKLIPYPPGLIVGGKILFHGENLLDYSDSRMEHLRGDRISMIFQEPMTSLNPVMTVGDQIMESLIWHRNLSAAEARTETVQLLGKMGIAEPEKRLNEYPHQFSGGMQQRVMIAMAMACKPEILIADEPTTALDVTVQAQVLEQMNALRQENDMALIIITHNLGIVARYADTVQIVYGGRIVESGNVYDIFKRPCHPYTIGLIRAVPRLDLPRSHGLATIEGEPPDMSKVSPESCAFQNRCPLAADVCVTRRPDFVSAEGENHYCACHRMEEVISRREELLK